MLVDISPSMLKKCLGDNLVRLPEKLGDADVNWRYFGVSTDTRTIHPGDVYIALKGEHFNGNLFVGQAFEAGAGLAIVDEPVAGSGPCVQVNDGLLALGQIAGWQRDCFDGAVLAVTGSSGKTSVKQLLAHVMSSVAETWMTPGNFNNHIGVPLTLLGLEARHRVAVVEQGASGLGEIAYTGQWVNPDVGIITNASASHLEGFGSLEGIVQTKGEMIDAVKPEGWVILNRDDAAFDVWAVRAESRRIRSFGLSRSADVYATDIVSDVLGSRFDVHVADHILSVSLPLPGLHNVRNALAVMAAATAAGLTPAQVVPALESACTVPGRMSQSAGRGGQRILDDSYNANPASLKAAIDVISVAPCSWLVIGDMGELGQEAEQAHSDIGRYAREQGLSALVATGQLSRNAVEAFGDGGRWFDDKSSLVEYINTHAPRQATVLVKGSRSAGMDTVVRALQQDSEE